MPKKTFTFGAYNPYRSSIDENLICIREFHFEGDKNVMSNFCDTFGLANLLQKPACHKNPEEHTCIDHLVFKPRSFQNSCVIEIGLLDFKRMTGTVTRMTFQKVSSAVVNDRECERFDNIRYKNDILKEIYNCYLEFNNSKFSGGEGMPNNRRSTCNLKAAVCARQSYVIHK